MNGLFYVQKMLTLIRGRRDQIDESLTEGPVTDFTVFKELRARRNELNLMEQDLRDLLKRGNEDDTDLA